MEKKQLLLALDATLKNYGFMRKGNSWVINGIEISKVINLQKSNFGDQFYLNYGFIIANLPLGDLKYHIFERLVPTNAGNVDELLDLSNDLSDKTRTEKILTIVEKELLPRIARVYSETDLANYLLEKSNLNAVPLTVKKYFKFA